MPAMKRIITNLFLIIFLLVQVACAQIDSSKSISAEKFKEELKNNKDLIVLDVRTPQELNGSLGKIEGSINIPVQDLEKRIGELAEYKNKEIAVICRSGNRSVKGTEILIENGFNAKNVLGGMQEFRK
jgi:rhodanese-related sulfurtransferase